MKDLGLIIQLVLIILARWFGAKDEEKVKTKKLYEELKSVLEDQSDNRISRLNAFIDGLRG